MELVRRTWVGHRRSARVGQRPLGLEGAGNYRIPIEGRPARRPDVEEPTPSNRASPRDETPHGALQQGPPSRRGPLDGSRRATTRSGRGIRCGHAKAGSSSSSAVGAVQGTLTGNPGLGSSGGSGGVADSRFVTGTRGRRASGGCSGFPPARVVGPRDTGGSGTSSTTPPTRPATRRLSVILAQTMGWAGLERAPSSASEQAHRSTTSTPEMTAARVTVTRIRGFPRPARAGPCELAGAPGATYIQHGTP